MILNEAAQSTMDDCAKAMRRLEGRGDDWRFRAPGISSTAFRARAHVIERVNARLRVHVVEITEAAGAVVAAKRGLHNAAHPGLAGRSEELLDQLPAELRTAEMKAMVADALAAAITRRRGVMACAPIVSNDAANQGRVVISDPSDAQIRFWLDPALGLGQVTGIWVHPSFRGLGLGTAMHLALQEAHPEIASWHAPSAVSPSGDQGCLRRSLNRSRGNAFPLFAPCPVCTGPLSHFDARYPCKVCDQCREAVTDTQGVALSIHNSGGMGYGVKITLVDGTTVSDSDTGGSLTPVVYVHGVRCTANEAHFGGIVILRAD